VDSPRPQNDYAFTPLSSLCLARILNALPLELGYGIPLSGPPSLLGRPSPLWAAATPIVIFVVFLPCPPRDFFSPPPIPLERS